MLQSSSVSSIRDNRFDNFILASPAWRMRASPWPPPLIALLLTVCILSMATSLTTPCPFCSFVFTNVREWMSHLRGAHSSEPHFNVTCGVSGCATTSRSFSALYSHIYRWHRDLIRTRSRPEVGQMADFPVSLETHEGNEG